MRAADAGEGVIHLRIDMNRDERVVAETRRWIFFCASGGTNWSLAAMCSISGFLMFAASPSRSWMFTP